MAPGDDLRSTMAVAVASASNAPCGPVVVIANADVMWSSADSRPEGEGARAAPSTHTAAQFTVASGPTPEEAAAALMNGGRAALVLGGGALTAQGIALADTIAQATGCKVFCETFNGRHARGAGVPVIERIPYFREPAVETLSPYASLVLAGSLPPVAFFASPGQRSELTAPEARMLRLPDYESPLAFLSAIANRVASGLRPRGAERIVAESPTGPLTPRAIWAVINRHLPAGALVADESGVTSVGADLAMQGAEPHVWMNLTGGSIGQGLPVATGAAIASPDSTVVAVQGDGGAMYTVQALWTQVREQAKVVNVIFRNDRYAILDYELKRLGLGPLAAKGAGMFELTRPSLDWVALAAGMGMTAGSADTAEAFARLFESAVSARGPTLIEARLSAVRPKRPA
jgi:acetolactate synthase-1/2/3 large subunit